MLLNWLYHSADAMLSQSETETIIYSAFSWGQINK